MKYCGPQEEFILKKYMEDYLSWEDSTVEQGMSVRRPTYEEQGAAEIWWIEHNTHSISLHQWKGVGV